MNLELLESFGQNYPEEFDGALDCVSIAVTCAFNKRGTLLAVGCNDGRIVVWDFLTRGISKIISAHVHPICSLCWSRNGQKLISASTDNNVAIWDVLSGECDYRYRFPSPVLKVQFHPRNDKTFLVCPMKHAAVLVNVDGSHSIVPLDEESDVNIVASFDRRGDHIYTGNAKGKILVLCCTKLDLVASFRVTTGTSNATAIKSIEFARRGDCFLVNTADRVIRVYSSFEILAWGKDGEPDPVQKLQDLVNKTMWKKCCFSGDGEYICAGSARQHALYIWEKSIGNLVKILHGTKGELLLDVVWHPVRPIITSISSGVVSIWAQNQVENWSAFAPDFKELDENVEYEERESEFDLEDEDKSVELNTDDTVAANGGMCGGEGGREGREFAQKQEEDEEVDVVTTEPIAAFCSSDEDQEDDNALIYLPISPEIDEPEEGWVQPLEQVLDETTSKRPLSSDQKENTSPKKKRVKTFDIDLLNAPVDEIHPLLNVKTKDKTGPHQPKKSGRPKSLGHRSDGSKPSPKSKHKEFRGSHSKLNKGPNLFVNPLHNGIVNEVPSFLMNTNTVANGNETTSTPLS